MCRNFSGLLIHSLCSIIRNIDGKDIDDVINDYNNDDTQHFDSKFHMPHSLVTTAYLLYNLTLTQIHTYKLSESGTNFKFYRKTGTEFI